MVRELRYKNGVVPRWFDDRQGKVAVVTAVAGPITFREVRAFKGARPQQILEYHNC